MVLHGVSRVALAAALATLGAVGCGSQPDESPDESKAVSWETRGGMFLHGQVRDTTAKDARTFSAPPGAHLSYFGGRIVSNAQVVQVIYGAGNYIPQVTSTDSPSMATFYQGVLNSAHVDWLTEYNTVGQPPPTSNQILGRGSFAAQATIIPSAANNGTVITDDQIQAELSAQLAAGNIPAPTTDPQGNNNTYYAIFFPHGKTITLGNAASCQVFCAYHGTIANAGGLGEIYYGVHPDFQPGSGCEFGCGAAATQFGNYTQVASHELIETMTDPEIGIATVLGPPLAWLDPVFSEIGDICNDQNGHVVGSDGITYDVQTEFSNTQNDCIVTGPQVNPLILGPTSETCHGTPSTSSVTVLGGTGRFTSDVTLSLLSVSPTPPAGGEITATFDPNPVPTPPTNGSTSTMRISSTASTPPGTYTLTIQASSSTLVTTATTTLVIRSQVGGAPTLQAPVDGTDGVTATPTFAWSSVNQATAYTLEIFEGDSCSGTATRTFTTGTTTFTVPPSQALPSFQSFSWQVTAGNACGNANATSTCFHFRTASCSDPRDVAVNGGFESGLTGWTVGQAVPPPLVSGANPHTGSSAVLLGNLNDATVQFGDSQISQVVTIAGGSPKLSFFEWPHSNDSITFDQQYVRVTPISPAGATVTLMSEARNDHTYIRREFDLSPFAGMTVQIMFGVHNDFIFATAMYIDDVAITSANCGPPEFAVNVTPPSPEQVCAGNSLDFRVSVESVNGPNFTSAVTLSASNLPPGATASFAQNPILPGQSTTMTLTTTRPTVANSYPITVSGVADKPPPDGARTATTTVRIDSNPPTAPEIISPRNGEVNVPRRPTLSWTAPFVPDSTANAAGAPPPAPSGRSLFPWEMAAPQPPIIGGQSVKPGTAPGGSPSASASTAPGGAGASVVPFAFGGSAYHVQVARDAAFTNIVVDAQVADTTFTVPIDLDIATQYFWRVSASNACGASTFSASGSFVVGACFEHWALGPAIPVSAGPLQSSVVAAGGKLYSIAGATFGGGIFARTDQVWVFDPSTGGWTRKGDVPAPGIGSSYGAAALLGGKIYVFGGFAAAPHRALWRYDIASDSWSRGADLPIENFGAAVAAIGGKIYVAYGSGFVTQTWQYDPVADTFTRKADAPFIPQPFRVHGAAVGGEMHVFAGGFEGNAHVIYNPATNTWRTGPLMPFTATDPAVAAIGSKIQVVGGRPTARNQIFDTATNTWSQGPAIDGAVGGIDNTEGAILNGTLRVVGGFDGTNGISSHWALHPCNAGGLSSAVFLPFVTDGNGKATGITNERTAVLIDNAVSGTPMTVSCFLYGSTGSVLGQDTFTVAPNEVKTIADVMRALTHSTAVQNANGSVAMFGTEVFHGLASVVNNASGDSMFESGRPVGGALAGYVPTVGSSPYVTQTVFTNASTTTALVQIVAYPPEGGDTPVAGTVAFIPPHGQVNYPDIIKKLALPTGFSGQLSWSSNHGVSVMARDIRNKNFSGLDPAHTLDDVSSTVYVPYVEDTAEFSTSLEISNPGAITANVTVRFVEASDQDGGAGIEHSRDIPLAINTGAPIADIVRWAQRDASTTPSGKRGFLVVTSPQGVTAQARIVDKANFDLAVPESSNAMTTGFSSVLVRVEPLPFARTEATVSTSASRFAVSNPGTTPTTVQLVAFNATGGSATTPLVVTLAPGGQFFSDNLARDMGLPAVFLGSLAVSSDSPVVVYNHRRTGQSGSAVPVIGQ